MAAAASSRTGSRGPVKMAKSSQKLAETFLGLDKGGPGSSPLAPARQPRPSSAAETAEQMSREDLISAFERLHSRMKADLATQADLFKEILRRPDDGQERQLSADGSLLSARVDAPRAAFVQENSPDIAAREPSDSPEQPKESVIAGPYTEANNPSPPEANRRPISSAQSSPASVVVEPCCNPMLARSLSGKSLNNAARLLHLDQIGAGHIAEYVYHEILDFRGKALRFIYTSNDFWMGLKEPRRTGRLASFIKSGKFEMFTLIIVCLNCLFIIRDQNENMRTMGMAGSDENGTSAVELSFAVYFLVELCFRLFVHRAYFFCNNDMGWNIVDSLIVGISTMQVLQNFTGESGGAQLSFLRSFRVLKLARVLRLVRMVKVFSDLRVMVIAFLNSCLALFWCMVLLIFTLAMFALVFVQLIGDFLVVRRRDMPCDPIDLCDDLTKDLVQEFGSVERTMLSLYMAVTGGNDWAYYFEMVAQTSDVAAFIFVFYTAFYYFGVFNLLTGMFVDKAVRASQPDQDLAVFEQRLQEGAFIKGFMTIFDQFDLEHDGLITAEEYEAVIKSDQGRIFLGVLGLGPTDTKIVFEALSRVQAKVPVREFVQGCLRMKGGATSIDMHSVQFEITNMHILLNEMNRELQAVRFEAKAPMAFI